MKEFGTILIAIISVLAVYPFYWIGGFLPCSILTVGVIYNLIKPFYDYRGRPFKIRLFRLMNWMLQILYQVWGVVKYIFLMVGYIIDLFGNVLLGELIEDIVTAEEHTLFSKGDVTISAALGDLEVKGKLNKKGMFISRILTKLDPTSKQHCIDAIILYKFKKKLNSND